MKIHFAVFFGVDYDLDLFPYWQRYYRDMRLDSYTAFLHSEVSVPHTTSKLFSDCGFNPVPVIDAYNNGRLQGLILNEYASKLPEEDVLVVADADEFHCVPDTVSRATAGNPPDYRELFEKYDIISGFLCDRYTEEGFTECNAYPFNQYPLEEPFNKFVFKNYAPPFIENYSGPSLRRTKILASRCGYKVYRNGSHQMAEVPSEAAIDENYKVLHFAWRKGSENKMKIKSYYDKEAICI